MANRKQSKRRARRLRKLAGDDGVAMINGNPVVAPLPESGFGHIDYGAHGEHEDKKRKRERRRRQRELRDIRKGDWE